MTYRSPTLNEIIETYCTVKDVGLKNIQIGNVGVFAKSAEQLKELIKFVGKDAFNSLVLKQHIHKTYQITY